MGIGAIIGLVGGGISAIQNSKMRKDMLSKINTGISNLQGKMTDVKTYFTEASKQIGEEFDLKTDNMFQKFLDSSTTIEKGGEKLKIGRPGSLIRGADAADMEDDLSAATSAKDRDVLNLDYAEERSKDENEKRRIESLANITGQISDLRSEKTSLKASGGPLGFLNDFLGGGGMAGLGEMFGGSGLPTEDEDV